jgi:plasmid stabilization system protein ParE
VATLRPLSLRYSARARAQLISIQEYIHDRNPAAAIRVGSAIREAGEILRYFPYCGRVGRSAETREWVVQGLPYVLVYEVGAGEIMILGVFHAAQDREKQT